ncbi:MAG: exosome complex RNA-binding protein Csl4 [Candidatus Bathyarchaeia archaeon]
MSKQKNVERFIVPGEKIGVIEEFIPDYGTYVENGVIYANNVGYVSLDLASRKVFVHPLTHEVRVPKVGSVVIGYVVNVQNVIAFTRIIKVGRRFLSGFFTGVLHVSDVDVKYTRDINDALKVSDLVRAKVISDVNRTFHLTTKSENLGVILALCSKCGGTLILKSKRGKKLYCSKCGNIETRKIASDYGSGNL